MRLRQIGGFERPSMCPFCQNPASKVVKSGFFYSRSHRSPAVQRYRCLDCRRRFSRQTGSVTCGEKKPQLTLPVMRLLAIGVSQRECARSLQVHRTTVARKMIRLGRQARSLLLADAARCHETEAVYFDEMETFEHTKCKPVSIALAVTHKRFIVSVEAASMPAKGKLAAVARKRYGHRQDDRPQAVDQVLATVAKDCPRATELRSDQCPRYPRAVRRQLPKLVHQRFKGRRGCVVGQGELKAGGHDPLFALNHTCAKFRDHLKRLTRRTWCTTKRIDRLQLLLNLYAWCHNQRLRHPGCLLTLEPSPAW